MEKSKLRVFEAFSGIGAQRKALECWRLMGFEDNDFEKAARVNSNSQLYKQAGNSIVVLVLEGIFENLFLQERGADHGRNQAGRQVGLE